MNRNRLLPALMLPLLAGLPAMAGNVPQHRVSNTAAPYSAIEGTPIDYNYNAGGTVAVFPVGPIAIPYAGKGFPIGFDIKFGGKWFNQFMVTSAGKLYLGEDEVEYQGTEAFTIGMSPVIGGVRNAEISYLTTGEAGEQVLTVQFANAVLEEDAADPGLYDMQIRLFEADGHAEIAFQEKRSPYSNFRGFDVSMTGWDDEDVLVITAPDIEADPVVSTFKKAYMLDNESYVHWNQSDGGELKSLHYSFMPETSMTPPKGAPTNLNVTQTGDRLDIALTRGRDARATVVLWSTEPITDADYPGDGETFRAGEEEMLGDVHAIYYGPSRDINLTIENVQDGTDYYVTALSANGYPAFNIENVAETVFSTSQSAPGMLYAVATGTNSIDVECRADNPVIIAKNTVPARAYQPGYTGLFGRPAADAAVGDEIEGGGEVIYVGEPSKFTVECADNELTYFRAWTLKDGRVSSNATDAHAIPDVTLPYAPGIENYPWGENIEGWDTGEEFIPWIREYYRDNAVYSIATPGYGVRTLSTPLLPLDVPVNISFELAMETERDWAATPDSGGIILPQGCEPGWFGPRGFLHIRTGNDIHKIITAYNGTMVGFDEQGYNDYSSTWEPISFDIPARGGMERITWEFCTEKGTRVFFRNIVITPLAEAPKAPEHAPADLKVTEDEDGIMTISCKRGEDATYTLVLFSTTPMTDAELPTDGALTELGAQMGNATVLYFGTDDEIECSTAYMLDNEPVFIFADYDTDYYVRAISGNTNPLYNVENMVDYTYHSLPAPGSGVEGIAAEDASLEVYTLTGIRLDAEKLHQLPAGIYIVGGKKLVVK